VTIVDVALDGESGFDLARQLAAASDGPPTRTILTSTHGEADLAELIAVTPVLGFTTKSELSADAIRDFVSDRTHGHGCRHEALVYSSAGELAAGALPFLRQGLAQGDDLLVVLREEGCAVLRRAFGEDAARIEFADARDWYRSPEHVLEQYQRYVGEHLARGAPRVRVVAEVIWPASSAATDIAGWKRYEAGISGAMAAVPVSFMCAYDTRELPAELIVDAQRTHPLLRSADGARPSAHYAEPVGFIRDLERDVPALAPRR
jgi:hypothetical protein